MPVATVSLATEKFDLKTLPEGYVVLKRMTFGQKLARSEKSTQQLIHEDKTNGNRQQRRGNQANDVDIEFKILQRAVSEFEFANCIVDHNLTHENGQPLDFKSPTTLDVLDPRIGDEISAYIGEMNDFDAAEERDKAEGKSPLAVESPKPSSKV